MVLLNFKHTYEEALQVHVDEAWPRIACTWVLRTSCTTLLNATIEHLWKTIAHHAPMTEPQTTDMSTQKHSQELLASANKNERLPLYMP